MNSIKRSKPGSNWAGNYLYLAKELYYPDSVSELQDLIRDLSKVKAVGSLHCFNDIADSQTAQISTQNLSRIIDIDEEAMQVTVSAGLSYGQICPELDAAGFALHNLASLPHISIAGACATGTHGSGVGNGNLGSAVSGLEFVSGTGDLVALTRKRDPDLLSGTIVNLGAVGVVTKVTLDIEKAFLVRQDVFQNLPFEMLRENFDAIIASGYSVSLFTDWQDDSINQIWIKRRLDSDILDLGSDFFGARAAGEGLHPLKGISAENCTKQMGVPGKWYERLPHFKMDFTPSDGDELQSEYFVAREHALSAISTIAALRHLIAPNLLVSEIRAIAADNQWLSPCRERDSVAFHFTWKQEMSAVNEILPIIEAGLAPFDARPHWGKLFTTSPASLHSLYPQINDFIDLMNTFDPHGKFRNKFLDRNFLN